MNNIFHKLHSVCEINGPKIERTYVNGMSYQLMHLQYYVGGGKFGEWESGVA